jgi:hypothetical protein
VGFLAEQEYTITNLNGAGDTDAIYAYPITHAPFPEDWVIANKTKCLKTGNAVYYIKKSGQGGAQVAVGEHKGESKAPAGGNTATMATQ